MLSIVELSSEEVLRAKARKYLAKNSSFSGGDALRGHTRSHPEHDG